MTETVLANATVPLNELPGLLLPALDFFWKWPWLGVVDAARVGPLAVQQIAAIDLLQHPGRRALSGEAVFSARRIEAGNCAIRQEGRRHHVRVGQRPRAAI